MIAAAISGFTVLLLLLPYFEHPEIALDKKYRFLLLLFSSLSVPVMALLPVDLLHHGERQFLIVAGTVTWIVNALALFLAAAFMRFVALEIKATRTADPKT